ncbi:MAG: guanylate kinase [Oscillospiraceae bacterium]|jgi:guanylate kinase|nr:guanylate kinase [Oscillospiraceae bacterium]
MNSEPAGGLLVVLSGPSGSGKDTILSELMKLEPKVAATVSATTRKPRSNEIDGKSYHFLSIGEFEKRIDEDAFLEYVRYGDNYYGTLKSEVDALLKKGMITVLVIEVRGAAEIIKKYPEAISIFLVAPSHEVLEARLRRRAEEDEEGIKKRLMIAYTEMERCRDYKYLVINDVLEDAVRHIYEIIQKEQQSERGRKNA